MDPTPQNTPPDNQKNVFIGLEAVTIVFLVVYVNYSVELSSSMLNDIFEVISKLALAATLPVWIIGAIHLDRIGKLKNYGKAFGYSLGIFLAISLLSLAIPFFYLLALISVIISFNYFAFKGAP